VKQASAASSLCTSSPAFGRLPHPHPSSACLRPFRSNPWKTNSTSRVSTQPPQPHHQRPTPQPTQSSSLSAQRTAPPVTQIDNACALAPPPSRPSSTSGEEHRATLPKRHQLPGTLHGHPTLQNAACIPLVIDLVKPRYLTGPNRPRENPHRFQFIAARLTHFKLHAHHGTASNRPANSRHHPPPHPKPIRQSQPTRAPTRNNRRLPLLRFIPSNTAPAPTTPPLRNAYHPWVPPHDPPPSDQPAQTPGPKAHPSPEGWEL